MKRSVISLLFHICILIFFISIRRLQIERRLQTFNQLLCIHMKFDSTIRSVAFYTFEWIKTSIMINRDCGNNPPHFAFLNYVIFIPPPLSIRPLAQFISQFKCELVNQTLQNNPDEYSDAMQKFVWEWKETNKKERQNDRRNKNKDEERKKIEIFIWMRDPPITYLSWGSVSSMT